LIAGMRGRYHADPLFARYGIHKVGDLYRQQLRLYAWKFWNGRLPDGQMVGHMAMVLDLLGAGWWWVLVTIDW
jgi:hypothetical protein